MSLKSSFLVLLLLWGCGDTLTAEPFKLGVENISDACLALLKKYRIGLIVNHTSKNQQGKRTIDLLIEKGLSINAVLVPEHGLDGTVHAAHEVKDGKDAATGLSIISLYGKGTGKKVPAEKMQDLDVLIFDIQDVGMRHYTYISTLFNVMKAAAEHKKYIIVFDRPNPLGYRMEGPLVDEGLQSFISIAPIPVRHSMTIGELARYFNKYHLNDAAKLHVVCMDNYQRTMEIPATLPLTLSPHLKSKDACYGYSFLGLLGEIRPFDVGLGSDKAFQCILLPDTLAFPQHKWLELSAALEKCAIKSSLYSYYSTRKKASYSGLYVQIPDINKAEAFKALLLVVNHIKQAGIALQFSQDFDKAIGTKKIQELFNGKHSLDDLHQAIGTTLQAFHRQIQPILLYKPFPHIVSM